MAMPQRPVGPVIFFLKNLQIYCKFEDILDFLIKKLINVSLRLFSFSFLYIDFSRFNSVYNLYNYITFTHRLSVTYKVFGIFLPLDSLFCPVSKELFPDQFGGCSHAHLCHQVTQLSISQ